MAAGLLGWDGGCLEFVGRRTLSLAIGFRELHADGKNLFGCLKDNLVLLLCLDERFLEEVGVCVHISIMHQVNTNRHHSLSLLANRIAKVCASGSPSLTSAAAFQTQDRSDPTFGLNFMSGTT